MSAVAAQHIARRAGWKTVALSDVAQVVNGGTPKSKVARYWGGDVQWLTPKDMGQMEGRTIATTTRTISKEGLANSSARLVPANSVILSTRAPIGHLAINAVPMAFNQGCRGIVPNVGLDTTFLYYFLLANKQRLDDLGSGTTFKELSGSNLKLVQLPLPALDEQKRIVAVLDQAFEALGRARAHAEANLADAAKLVEVRLSHVFNRTDPSELNDVASVFRTGTGATPPKSNKSLYGDEIRFVKPPELLDGVVGDTVDGLSEAGRAKARIAPAGTVLVSCIGNLGKIGLVDSEAAFNQQINAIFPNYEIARSRFVYWQCRSSIFRKQLEARSSGTTVSIVNKTQFNQLKLWLPSLQEQDSLVEHLDELEKSAMAVSDIYAVKLKDLAALRQSLLQKAFAGELA